MSPIKFSCILCGFPIYDPDASTTGSWLGEFRIISSDTSGTFVSGVGYREDSNDTVWAAPTDPNLRWDDERSRGASTHFGVMRQSWSSSHGFVTHDACWRLLKTAFLPVGDEVPLKRLLDICESLPFPLPGLGVYWGHDYGNLIVDIEGQGLFPWEEDYLDDRYHPETEVYAKEDPYHVSDIPALLLMRTEYPSEWSISTPSRNKDFFSKLPLELLENIALRLPTRSALSLRHVSKVFFPLLYSQTFWASRFEANGDRGFMFEKWEHRDTPGDATDWLSLYRLTSLARCSPGIKNRKRSWDLLGRLVETITLSLAENQNAGSEGQDLTSLKWTKVEGDLLEDITQYPRLFDRGCRRCGTHVSHVPQDLSKIGFSISSVGNASYISGIRLIANNESDVCLGLISTTEEVVLEVTTLRGLVLAMGSRGLQALRVVQADGSRSEWVGSPSNAPRTERLVCSDKIDFLEVGFDGFKIVSIRVAPSVQASVVQGRSLREIAHWYPSLPGPESCLNETSFTGGASLGTRYLPLFWVDFGGPGGCNLQYLTRICFDVSAGFYGLEFHYDMNPKLAICKLGRCRGTFDNKNEFAIDGAGGEVIETVEVDLTRISFYSFLKHGKLCAVKITTNRKRSFQAGYSSEDSGLEKFALSIAPGTTLTGFYASQDVQSGLISLGAISEVIGRRQE